MYLSFFTCVGVYFIIGVVPVTLELLLNISYATKIDKIPKMGVVYRNKYKVVKMTKAKPKGLSNNGIRKKGVGMENTIYTTNKTNNNISKGDIDFKSNFIIILFLYILIGYFSPILYLGREMDYIILYFEIHFRNIN
jgi:hypothetical protein